MGHGAGGLICGLLAEKGCFLGGAWTLGSGHVQWAEGRERKETPLRGSGR